MITVNILLVGCLILGSRYTSALTLPWDREVQAAACQPCDDGCDPDSLTEAEFASAPRVLLWNDTSPWGENEVSQWRIRLDEDGNLLANDLQFDCSKMSDVCSNMCYGVYCKGRSWTLNINRDNKKLCTQARQKNNCGNRRPNYCSSRSGFPAGYNCDEYPFASTTQGQTGTRIATRCVATGQNNYQGGTISAFYNNGNRGGKFLDGTSFDVVMINYRGIRHCEAYKSTNPAVCTIGTTTNSERSQT